jgi:predicted nucleic acid-binding protein
VKPLLLSSLLYKEGLFSMNLHALTFEQILRLCSSLEDPNEIARLIQALEILERNLRYRRKELIGQMNRIEARDKTEKQKERQALKKSLRVIRAEVDDKAPEEDAT